jgi:hypothetical protein
MIKKKINFVYNLPNLALVFVGSRDGFESAQKPVLHSSVLETVNHTHTPAPKRGGILG